MRAFTLLEILIVIGIIGVLASLTLPWGMDFYKSQQLASESQAILQVLRRAQSRAMFQESDSGFGVYFSGNRYVLFKGSSFAGRDSQFDEIFDLPAVVVPAGLAEVVFSKMEGKPSVTGDIILTSGSARRIININGVGRINYE